MATRPSKARLFQADGKAGASLSASLVAQMRQYTENVRERALRAGTAAAAEVFYREMRVRVPVETGQLRDSIYQYRNVTLSVDGKHVYEVGPNKRIAPHWYNVEYGHWRYNASANGVFWLQSKSKKNARVSNPPDGFKAVHDLPGALDVPAWTPASPYIRPTWDAKSQEALQVGLRRVAERISELQREGASVSSDATVNT